jgi:hypothetical protein
MTKPLNPKLLREFLQQAGNQLKGSWLLVGGTLLPALGINVRSTVDIDLISLGEKENSQTLALMELADSLGLPIETVNQAAAFFLKNIPYEKTDLIPLHEGDTAKIFRPSVLLYWKLKLARLSESDLIDCQHYYSYCLGQKDSVKPTQLEHLLLKSLKTETSSEKKLRIKFLISLL